MGKYSFIATVIFAFMAFLFSTHAFAQSTTPQAGGACSQVGAFAGNYNSGAGPNGNLLVCNGANWVRFMGYNIDGNVQAVGEVIIGAAPNVVCNSSTAGGLRFNNSTISMEFCDGTSWKVFPFTLEACTTPGEVCQDGTIMAGTSPDGSAPMFTTPCDSNQYWNGSSCVVLFGHWSGVGSGAIGTYGAFVGMSWNDGSTNVATGYTSTTTGAANTAGLAGLAASYHAARYCANLVAYGHSDWYLPARLELIELAENQDAIGNFTTEYYRSATESGASNSTTVRFSNNTAYNSDKNSTNHRVRCVRKD